MVFATTFHDSGYREFEGNPPINAAKGRPYAHREDVPNFEAIELAAYRRNAEWVGSHDPYAGLLVSMHRTGLWHNRYNVFTEPSGRLRERSPDVQAVKKDLEATQQKTQQALAAKDPGFENELAYNYRALQIYDLLSLYFCCDGYANENTFKEYKLAPVRVAYESDETVVLRIIPNGNGVRFDPYPFDVSPLQVSVRARVIKPVSGQSEEAGLETYQKAAREIINFQISR
jgi:hypothetical protein